MLYVLNIADGSSPAIRRIAKELPVNAMKSVIPKKPSFIHNG